MKMNKSKEKIYDEILVWFSKQGETQSVISVNIGLTQGQLSKLLNGKFKSVNSKAIDKLCKYANIEKTIKVEVHPEKSKRLINAIKEVWDGSNESERKIAQYIRALKGVI